LNIEGPLSTPISIDSSITEYEITRLKADTNYIVIVKLYNEAGVAEQKFRIKTNKENSGKRKSDASQPLERSWSRQVGRLCELRNAEIRCLLFLNLRVALSKS
jgi:predicted metal-dependent peptidase